MSRPIYFKPSPFRFSQRQMLWFASLGGGILWFSHFLIVYVIGEFGCLLDSSLFTVSGFTATQFFIGLFTLIFALASAFSIFISLRVKSPHHSIHQEPGAEENRFLSQYAVLANSLFFIAILAQSTPLIFLSRGC